MRRLSWQRLLLTILWTNTLYLAPSMSLAAQQSPGTTPSGAPAQMHLCVDGSCEKLVWRGSYYDGIKDNGSDIVTHYTVSEWSAQGVRLEGRSIAPVSQGAIQLPGGFRMPTKTYMEATFTGPISADGNSIENGVVNWKLGKLSGEKVFKLTWEIATSQADLSEACPGGLTKMPPPSAMLVCDGPCMTANTRELGTWVFSGNKGTADWSGGSKAALTIQEWSDGKLTILREDTPQSASAGISAVYRGTVCGDTIKGTASARWPGHWEGVLSGVWKAEIPVTSCDGVGDDTMALMDTAQRAIRFRQPDAAFKCLSRAADLGDRDARTATGLMYRDGIGTKVSYPNAIRLLKQGAIQQDYNAQVALSQIYDIGVGAPADPKEADHWRKIAYNNPQAVAARAAAEAQGKREQFMFLGLSALVEGNRVVWAVCVRSVRVKCPHNLCGHDL